MAKKQRNDDHEAEGAGGWMFALGAGAGLALGMFLSGQRRGLPQAAAAGMARGARAAARIRPGRLRRGARDHRQLTRMEDDVLSALIRDDVLAARGIDVGAISPGIIELSGGVRTPLEAERAVSVAARVSGVETVVNRLEVETLIPAAHGDEDSGGRAWGGRVSGMGRRRQSLETDPAQRDDSRHIREVALEKTDRREFVEEGISHAQPRMAARSGPGDENPTHFAEDELDHQDPHRSGAEPVGEPPGALRTAGRVGEGVGPGTELRLEQADVPVKPHAGDRPADAGDARR